MQASQLGVTIKSKVEHLLISFSNKHLRFEDVYIYDIHSFLSRDAFNCILEKIHKMRLILILSALNSVQAQIQLSPTRQNLSLPGLEIEYNAKSGFYFQRTSTLYANQRFAHIVMMLDLNFFESRKQGICDSYLQFRSTVNNIKKYRVVGQSAT